MGFNPTQNSFLEVVNRLLVLPMAIKVSLSQVSLQVHMIYFLLLLLFWLNEAEIPKIENSDQDTHVMVVSA